MPAVTKIIRKPKSVELEITNVACATSGMMLFLELKEGKDKMANREFSAYIVPPGRPAKTHTSLTLRLTKNWHGTQRTVVGDSRFASVNTAVALKKHGLYFIGNVKVAKTLYPHKYLNHFFPVDKKGVCSCAKGSSLTLTAKEADVNLIAHAWSDRTRFFFVSTGGTTMPAPPDATVRSRSTTQRTMIANEYFSGAESIDVHNHFRQGGTALEDIRTTKWYWRVIWTIVGMVETDSYLAWRQESGSTTFLHTQFTQELAIRLIQNQHGGRRSLQTVLNPSAPLSDASAPRAHILKYLRDHPYYIEYFKECERLNKKPNRVRRRCEYCHEKSSTYCDLCSTQDTKKPRLVAVCASTRKNGGNFLSNHSKNN